MALNDYGNLKSAIEDWSQRNDVTSRIDDFLDIAESEIFKKLRIRDMLTLTSSNTSAGSRFLALPTRFQEMRRVRLVVGGQRFDVDFAGIDSFTTKTGSGRPQLYTITDQIEFNRAADSVYTVELLHYASLEPLSDSNTTNALLTRFPFIYLNGALWALFTWAKEPLLAQQHRAEMISQIEEANAYDMKGNLGSTPSARVNGPTP